jgi:hypothetical protein
MSPADFTHRLANPYAQGAGFDGSGSSARVVRRALAVGALGLGAAAVLTGTGSAAEGDRAPEETTGAVEESVGSESVHLDDGEPVLDRSGDGTWTWEGEGPNPYVIDPQPGSDAWVWDGDLGHLAPNPDPVAAADTEDADTEDATGPAPDAEVPAVEDGVVETGDRAGAIVQGWPSGPRFTAEQLAQWQDRQTPRP